MRYLRDVRGVDTARIRREGNSHSTLENFTMSYDIIKSELGEGAKIAFVTTRFHVYRAEKVAKSLGIETVGIGSPGVWYITPMNYLRECAAITQYWFTGKIS